MSWMFFRSRLGRDQIAQEPPEALVILLHDLGASAVSLASVAAHWSVSVPAATFIALDGLEQLDAGSFDPGAAPGTDVSAEPTLLDRASDHLETLLRHQLHSQGLDANRLVLVGFGYGGTLALHLLLRQGWSCAGILAIAAQLVSPLPRILRIDCKVRMVDCAGDAQIDHSRLRERVARLTALGLDTRGVLLAGSPFSENAIRHGGAYLVELVATAQRGGRFHADRESSRA
jgi:predicted esterase